MSYHFLTSQRPAVKPHEKQWKFRQGWRRVQKRPRSMNLCTTGVEVQVARTLCTTVRATSVSRQYFLYFRAETVCVFCTQLCTTALYKALKHYKTSERSPKVLLKEENVWFQSVFTNNFRNMRTNSNVKLQTFGPEGAEGRSS